MKQIALNGKYGIGKFTLVDDEDFETLNKFSWYVTKFGYVGRTTHIYKDGKDYTRRVLLSREVLKNNANLEVDHISGNKLDNRRINLRLATRSLNSANRGPQSNNTTGYKGVIFNKKFKKWRMHIKLKTKGFLGKLRATPEEAALDYNQKAKELFGEYAWLNKLSS